MGPDRAPPGFVAAGYRPKKRRPAVALADVFAIVQAAALAGQRCPITGGPGADGRFRNRHLGALARRGWIRIEISGRNWRTVTLLRGPHAGRTTRPNPDPGARVYLVIDTGGTRRLGADDRRDHG